jgi:dTDP-4-amino-4,6-dideoxygalactose transaminase
MSAPRIPLSIPNLGAQESAAVARCITDNWVSSAGPDVVAFERRMAEFSGRAHGMAIVNGTAALYVALRAVGVEAGDRVLLPDFTFAATANAVLHAGGIPVFLDVTEESWTLDSALLADAIRKHKPKAILPVHVLGHPADIDAINAVCRQAKVAVIEDAAGAIGARYRGRPAGGLGDAAVFSFNGNKTVTTGGGGMIVTDNAAWADRIRALSTQARDGDRYRYREASFNFRMPNLNAALGLAQLGRLDEMLGAKRKLAARYDEILATRDDLVAMPRCAWAESGCWLYSVRCASRADAGALVYHMDGAGIDARVFWEVLSDQAPYADAPRHLTGVAARLSGAVVSLPCSSHLTEAEQARVIDSLSAWRGGRLKAAA